MSHTQRSQAPQEQSLMGERVGGLELKPFTANPTNPSAKEPQGGHGAIGSAVLGTNKG